MNAWARGPTRQFAEFAAGLRHADLDEIERHAAARHLLDTLGACIAGSTSDVSRIAQGLVAEIGGGGAVPVPGFGGRYDRPTAAWLAGACAHGLEVDDGYRAGSVHPGAVVVPALIAAAAGASTSGERVLAALAVGYEFSTRIAEAMHPASRERGFHNTPVAGVLAAAAAVGSLRGHDAETIERALGIAASSAAGLFAFLEGGGEIKRLHAGFAAREGLMAALLAERGMTGPKGVLEGKDGFFQAYSGVRPAAALTEGLWPRSGRAGLNVTRCYVKPYACCRHIHPAIDAVLDVLASEGVEADEVDRVDAATYGIAARHALSGWADMASAQLSYQFCVATAMRHNEVSISRFDAASRADPLTNAWCARIHVALDDECEATYPSLRSARVTVALKDGRRFGRFIDEPSGSARHPLSDERLVAKFRALAVPVIGAERTERAVGAVFALAALDDVDGLIGLVGAPGSTS